MVKMLKMGTDNGNITCFITVPANSTATLYLPVIKGKKVSESGREITGNKYVTLLKGNEGLVISSLKSGSYSFEIH